LRNETETILDSEKKKLEEKQHKTQDDMEKLVDLNITYRLVDGGEDAWNDVPILFTNDIRRYTLLANRSVTYNEDEILELKKQIQLLKQKITLIGQTKELPPSTQEESIFQLQLQEKDRQITLLRNDFQLLQHKNVTFQNQIKTNDSKIASLQTETQELKLKNNSLEQQVREKESKIALVQSENQSLKLEKASNEYQLKETTNKMNTLQSENRIHRTSSLKQNQKVETLNLEKTTLEQNRMSTSIEMERLKASNIVF
jgi:FtsZ-binding cell division protein ZapB